MKIKEEYLTPKNLSIIQNIDDTFYTNAITGIGWYHERYNSKHKCLMLYDGDKCVGYLMSVTIKKELYNAIINGVLLNDVYINPKMFVEKSKFNYVVSCVLLKEYRGKGYGSIMMKQLFDKTADGKYCAIAISKDGYHLAQKYMNEYRNLNENTAIFIKNIKSGIFNRRKNGK